MSNHPADDPTRASWRCGARLPATVLANLEIPEEVCTLPVDHAGWHQGDSGNQWSDDGGAA